jgi:hypothetical protein
MFYVTYGLSQGKKLYVFPHTKALTIKIEKHHNYHQYSHLLTKGWLFGRKVDNSDMQYRQFRNNLPLLFLLACVYLLASYFYRSRNVAKTKKSSLNQIRFYLAASLIFVIALHGSSVIKMMVILTINYYIGKLGGSFNPVLTWTFNLTILFLNERYAGYKFASIGLDQLVK